MAARASVVAARGVVATAGSRALALAVAASVVACVPAKPPRSPFPTADDALDRMRATYRCDRGVHADAKFDHLSDDGRVRGSLLLFAARPDRLRLDVLAPPPFQSIVATLTADGERFSLADLRAKRFLEGPASACNIARLTRVPVPGHALVTLLNGQAPVLVHDRKTAAIAWSGRGYFVVRLPSEHGAVEEIHLAPVPADFDKPWAEQRVRVLDVRVEQRGVDLYHAALWDHAPAATAGELRDPDGIDPPVPPSGPLCAAELPRAIEVEVPGGDQSLRLRYQSASWNPPLPEGAFSQPVPDGVERARADCE